MSCENSEKLREDYRNECVIRREKVKRFAGQALLVAWDGCHKVYLAMDEVAARWFRREYEDVADEDVADTALEWYDGSCMLRFVEAVWGSPDGACRFEPVIEQCEDWYTPGAPDAVERDQRSEH